jgi:hypothetical protein
MRTISARAAGRLIAKSPGIETVYFESAGVDDIVSVILRADSAASHFVQQLAPKLMGRTDMDTLRNVWAFTKEHIRYKRDKAGDERIQSPGALWKSRQGDCKSFSIFNGALLRALGISYFYRLAKYDPQRANQAHIYPVAILPSGEEIVMDSTHSCFGCEYEYWRKKDYMPHAQRGAAVGAASVPRPNEDKVLLKKAFSWVLIMIGISIITTD